MPWDAEARDSRIRRAGSAGMALNAVIAILMAALGTALSSYAMVADAVSQLSEIAASVASLSISRPRTGSRRSALSRDGGFVIAAVMSLAVLIIGAALLWVCIGSITDPDPPEFTLLTVAITVTVTAVKILAGRHLLRMGEEAGSAPLEDSGRGSIVGSSFTAAIAAVAIVSITADIALDAVLGAVISLFIVLAGVRMLYAIMASTRGRRTEDQIESEFRSAVERIPDIGGVTGLIVRDHGLGGTSASVYIDVFDSRTSSQIEDIERKVTEEARERYGSAIRSVKVHVRRVPREGDDRTRADAEQAALQCDGVERVGDIAVEGGTIRLLVLARVDSGDPEGLRQEVASRVRRSCPGYDVEVLFGNADGSCGA